MSNPSYVQDYNAVVEVVNKYIEGNSKASGATMKPAFHAPSAARLLAGSRTRRSK
jgi:hypothetical protein